VAVCRRRRATRTLRWPPRPPCPPTPSARLPAAAAAPFPSPRSTAARQQQPRGHRTIASSRAPPPPFCPRYASSIRFATPTAPPRPRLSQTRVLSAFHAQVRANWLLSSSTAAMAAVGRRAWPELLHPPPPFPVRALRSPDSRDARTPSLVPHHGRCWPPDGEQRHRPAIPTGELPPELPRCSGLARSVRLGAESMLVPSPSLETSPAAREPLVSAALLGFG
jgi:hypothetical protein